MTNGLDRWLKLATHHLSSQSAAQVRTEIEEHYESSRDAAIQRGAAAPEADREALAALGDARTANRQYRGVLLTTREARLLREATWEARAICGHSVLKPLLMSLPGIALVAALELFRSGAIGVARDLLLASVGLGLLFLVPFLPVYTPARSRAVRYLRWVVLAGLPVMAFWPDPLRYSWLLIATLWPIGWIEWTRISIRRKLPVAQWPKHLYL